MRLSELLAANASIKGQLNKVEVEISILADLQAAIDKLTADLDDVELNVELTRAI